MSDQAPVDSSKAASEPRIVALIAAHNESEHVAAVVAGLKPFGLHRILVVDDASDDGTEAIARRAGAEVLRLEAGRGQGPGAAGRHRPPPAR